MKNFHGVLEMEDSEEDLQMFTSNPKA